jgi:hypothetical protein
VELAPAVLPARLDLLDRGTREPWRDALRVRSQLDRVAELPLLEPRREQLEPASALDLRPLVRDDRGDPEQPQRKALLSFSKKPSSAR